MTDKRYATCIACSERWNISAAAVIPERGYICPPCTVLMEKGIPLRALRSRAKKKAEKRRRTYGKSQ